MGGCPAGAVPSALGANTQQLLDASQLPLGIASIFSKSLPLALASLVPTLVDINQLCSDNPNPPAPVDAATIAAWSAYAAINVGSYPESAVLWLSDYLKYQAFQQFCVCTPPTLDPTLNCIHATNVSIPATVGALVQLGAIVIEPAVYDSWPVNGTTWSVHRTAATITSGGAVPGHDWDLQLLSSTGVWESYDSDDTITEGTTSSLRILNINGYARFPRSVSVRLRNNSGRATVLSKLDYCFVPFTPSPSPIPPQPDLPTLPTVPQPDCSGESLCALILEMQRLLHEVLDRLHRLESAGDDEDLVEVASQTVAAGDFTLNLPTDAKVVKLELSALPPDAYHSQFGNPRGLMLVGSVRWVDEGGVSERIWVDAPNNRWQVPMGAESISVQLRTGCIGIFRFYAPR